MFGDVYAIGCLVVWGIPVGCAVAMLAKGCVADPEKTGKFPEGMTFAALLVAILIPMVLSADNPNFLAVGLMTGTLLLAGIGFLTLRFRLQRWGIGLALAGTLILFFTYFEVPGYLPDGSRYKARLISLESDLKMAAKNDPAIYPEGSFDAGHPAMAAHPELLKAWDRVAALRPVWHTCFTKLRKCDPLPPPEFRAGTLGDNLDALREYIRDHVRVQSREGSRR